MLTPAIYRTRITHLRRAPVHHYFEQRGYCWYGLCRWAVRCVDQWCDCHMEWYLSCFSEQHSSYRFWADDLYPFCVCWQCS